MWIHYKLWSYQYYFLNLILRSFVRNLLVTETVPVVRARLMFIRNIWGYILYLDYFIYLYSLLKTFYYGKFQTLKVVKYYSEFICTCHPALNITNSWSVFFICNPPLLIFWKHAPHHTICEVYLRSMLRFPWLPHNFFIQSVQIRIQIGSMYWNWLIRHLIFLISLFFPL